MSFRDNFIFRFLFYGRIMTLAGFFDKKFLPGRGADSAYIERE